MHLLHLGGSAKVRLDSHGGALVNLIHSYTDNGDPFVRKFTDELLEEVRILRCQQKKILWFSRCRGRSLRHFKSGYFLVNYMILSKNSLLLRIQCMDTSRMSILRLYQAELANCPMKEFLGDLAETPKTCRAFERTDKSFGRPNTAFVRICSPCL